MLQLASDLNDLLWAAGERGGSIAWVIKPTGWNDANGIHGYDLVTLKAGIQTSRLAAREEAAKGDRDSRPASGAKQ